MDSVRYIGARRGVFGLQNWAPPREPGQPVSFLNHSDRQPVNAPAPTSPLFNAEQSKHTALQMQHQTHMQQQLQQQQQQLLYAAQSAVLPDRHAEHIAENKHADKPRELSGFIYT